MEFKSSNPFLKTKKFENTSRTNEHVITADHETMTVSGTINKSFTMLLMLLSTAVLSWWLINNGYNPMVFTLGGGIIGFVLVLVASFKPTTAPYTAPAYALFEGLFIGGISAVFEAMYPGLVIQAVSATFVTFLVCFALYKYKIVKVTETFKSVVVGATMAIFAFYLISWVTSLFIDYQPIHHGNSLMSIGISVFVIIIAALNLFLDFDMIEKGAKSAAPKFMEWFAAMGLMITLVWLYVEFLRLLSKISSRD
ncbi:Bax inhibitor-1/YccA family protein [uncultured Flavobacterium sp.]|uniref:Bax inhibitor-1/YccA family protein n=1 Tax=uncultured Flavobacterium sp. TaxID=165435 RepID=UPI0030CA3C22